MAARADDRDTPSEEAVEQDFTIPADADVETGDDEAQPA